MVMPTGAQTEKVMEGFDPKQVYCEIMEREARALIRVIDRDFSNETQKFGFCFVNQVKKMIGEVIYEISEGLHGGLNDLIAIIQKNTQDLLHEEGVQNLNMLMPIFVGQPAIFILFTFPSSHPPSIRMAPCPLSLLTPGSGHFF